MSEIVIDTDNKDMYPSQKLSKNGSFNKGKGLKKKKKMFEEEVLTLHPHKSDTI
jgi:hypothetical protein